MVAEHSVGVLDEDFVEPWWARGVMGGWGRPVVEERPLTLADGELRHTLDISACG